MIVGIDIGGHHIAGALVGLRGDGIVAETYRHLDIDRAADREALLNGWAGLIDHVRTQQGDDVDGVGIAMPGPFDYRTGVAWFQDNGKFESLYGVDVRAELRRRTRGGPEIRFINDATAFAVGCVAMGAVPPCRRVLALTLGTGLGSAFLEDGVPVIDAIAGEVPEHGCLWHLPYRDGTADDYVSSRWIQAQARTQLGNPADVAQLACQARAGGPEHAIFETYGAHLAEIIAPWVRGFGAGAIVLGGRITGAYDLFSASLLRGLTLAGIDVPIAIHENTEDAAITGAARMFDVDFWSMMRHRLPAR